MSQSAECGAMVVSPFPPCAVCVCHCHWLYIHHCGRSRMLLGLREWCGRSRMLLVLREHRLYITRVVR